MKNQKVRTAYHEAGHVVTLYLLTGKIDPIKSVDIITEGSRLGACKSKEDAYLIEDASVFETFGVHEYNNWIEYVEYDTVKGFREILDEVCYCLGGGVSEMLYCGLKRLPRKGMSGDFDSIYILADKMLPIAYDKTGVVYYPALNSMIDTCLHFLKSLLSNDEASTKIKVIAEALLEHKALDSNTVLKLLKKTE